MKHEIVDSGDPKKYWTAIPNIIYTLGLSPFELALYNVLKRTAGEDGKCWKSRAVLARESGMSPAMVTKAKQSLCQRRVGGKPLIVVTEETNKNGGLPRQIITISDVWAENMGKFTRSQSDVDSHAVTSTVTVCQPTSPYDQQGHTVAHKKNQEEDHKEERKEEIAPPFCGPDFLEALDDYKAQRGESKHPLTVRSLNALYRQLAPWGEPKATVALRESVISNWRGVFEPHTNGNGNGHGGSKAERSQEAGRKLIERYEREDRESQASH